MRITIKDLQRMRACESGVAAFREVCGDVIEGEWTAEAQAFALSTPLRRYLGWAVHVGLIPLWSMNRWDLTRADLTDADLTRANLRYANLGGADLTRANLRRADLRYADLRYADLTDADLRCADLRYADLTDADLGGHDADDLRRRGAIV